MNIAAIFFLLFFGLKLLVDTARCSSVCSSLCLSISVSVSLCVECASVGEYRDLLSEFSLLKHVSHKNVIQLLGVCSRDGLFDLDDIDILTLTTSCRIMSLSRTHQIL